MRYCGFLGCALLALGCCDPAADVDAGSDGAIRLDDSATADAFDASGDVPTDSGAPFCENMGDGTECGSHRECRSGECVFTEPDTPCDYDFASAPSGALLVVACDHDLAGASISLAANITLEHNGGSITNGTLELNATSIHGELLNLSLEIDMPRDDTSSLIDPTFVLRKERWGIEEGSVSDAVAVINRDHINAAIQIVKALLGDTFVVGALDVFIDVATGPFGERPILIPSDFHLQMSDQTHLRVQPNNAWEYSLMLSLDTRNVRITGGHLWGDRFEHDYTEIPGRRHDQGIGLSLLSTQNVVVENLSANRFMGDGLLLSSARLRNDDGSPQEGRQYAENVEIRGCAFDENRRNGVALTDIDGAVLENLTITRTALDTDDESTGTSPRTGLQIEPITGFLPGTETLRIRQRVTNIQIRNNRFDGNVASDITFHHCDNTEVYENDFGGGITSISAAGVHFHHNTFIADRPDRPRAIGVGARQRDSGYHVVREWDIHDNTIDGYEVGIGVGGVGQRVRNNTVRDFRLGMQLGINEDLLIEDNTLSSTREDSRAYTNLRGGQRTVIGTIRGGSASCTDQPIRVLDVNNERSATERLVFRDIVLTSSSGAPVYVQDSSHITVEECTADDFEQLRSTDVIFRDNTVR